MKVYPPRDIRPFVMYCVNGKRRSSLLIESTDSMILFLFSSGPIAIVSYLLTLVYMYIRSIFLRDVQCANVFSVTRPSLNRSFTIKHTVSLPLRRHSYTQSQLATSVKRHSDLIPYLARGSLGTRARAPSTNVRRS